jgi:hypothetical protein
MNSNKKIFNYKVLEIIEIYNFCSSHFSTRLHMNNLRFEFQNTKTLNIVFHDKIISNQKVVNYKVL